jgi:hypothetical protein
MRERLLQRNQNQMGRKKHNQPRRHVLRECLIDSCLSAIEVREPLSREGVFRKKSEFEAI